MPKVKVDLLSKEIMNSEKDTKEELSNPQERAEINEPRRKRNQHKNSKRKYNIKKIIASVIIVIIVCLAVFSSSIVFSDENLIKNISKLNLIQQVGRLIGSSDKELIGEDEDRINILLIGMGGKGHEGGTLADTIILGSFKPSTNQVAMLSIPRDLSVTAEGYDWVKINALHAYGERDGNGKGGEAMTKALSDLLETEIHYFATVDFSGFEKLIDEFGGVDIEVERDLIDPQYPIRGKEYIFPIENRYETLNIKAGLQHMDGSLALKYARSRHAVGIEGSDFARARRQQKILAELKSKIFSVETFLNPKKINGLLNAYNEHIYTNLEIWQMLKLAQMGKEVDPSKIISYTLSDGPNGLLYPKIVNGAYVLLPDDGSYQEIKDLWQNIFYAPGGKTLTTVSNAEPKENKETIEIKEPEQKEELELPKAPITDYTKENATIEIRNGTWINGYAGTQKTELEKKDLDVIEISNADSHEYEKTIIYDLSKGDYPGTSAELFKIYGARPLTEIPVSINSNADFLIILGEN